jgi:hypothetical protein
MLSEADKSELVIDFWDHMLNHYGVRTQQKSQSEIMALAAEGLEALGLMDSEIFLKRFVTTICTFSETIYTPFEIGDFSEWAPWSQIRVCCHECQHVVQAKREGWTRFDALYLASSSFRAGYEAECFGTDMEMSHWLLGNAFDPSSFAQSRPDVLKGYGCNEEDIQQAVGALIIRASVVAAGGVETDAARTAILWFETNSPNLRKDLGL